MAVLNKAFAAMDVVDGIGKTKGAYNASTNNKYDNILGTKPIKTTSLGGNVNAVNGKNNQMKRMMLASDELDGMVKQASNEIVVKTGVNARSRKDNFKNTNFYKNMNKAIHHYKKNEEKASSHLKSFSVSKNRAKRVMSKSFSSGQYKAGVKGGYRVMAPGMKHLGKGMLRSTPALAGMAGAGYGTYRAMKHFEDKKKPIERNELFPKAMGVTIGGAMAINGFANKNPYRAYNLVGKSLSKSVKKIPMKVVKKSGPVGEFAADVTKNVSKKLKNVFKDESAGVKKHFSNPGKSDKGAKKPHFKKDRGMNKKASEELDFFFQKSAANLDRAFAKDVFKNNLIKPGVESIPYFAGSALISKAVGVDFRKARKIDKNKDDVKTVVVDIPVEKKASVQLGPKTEQFIRRGAEGIGRTVIPGTLSIAIGKNIMDNMNNVKSGKDDKSELENILNEPIPKGKARIIYQTPEKKASNELEDMIKISSENEEAPKRVSEVLEELNGNIQAERGNNHKSVNRNVRLAQGIRKKHRINE